MTTFEKLRDSIAEETSIHRGGAVPLAVVRDGNEVVVQLTIDDEIFEGRGADENEAARNLSHHNPDLLKRNDQ